MPRKTIIFGNDLGMALSPGRYSLDHAIGTVWGSEDLLSEEHKELIVNCLPDDRAGRPRGEDELDKLQLALSACDFLNGIPGAKIHWLTDEGQQFPDAVRKLIYNTALQFHQTGEELPEHFVVPFADFIESPALHHGGPALSSIGQRKQGDHAHGDQSLEHGEVPEQPRVAQVGIITWLQAVRPIAGQHIEAHDPCHCHMQ